ncbi:hypothetical protein MY3957_007637 [Beauveria namnaoensis]
MASKERGQAAFKHFFPITQAIWPVFRLFKNQPPRWRERKLDWRSIGEFQIDYGDDLRILVKEDIRRSQITTP